MTHSEITALFNEYNNRFFDNKLPAIEIRLESRKTKRCLGMYCWKATRCLFTGAITVKEKYIRIFKIAIQMGEVEETLYHEMVHYYLHHTGHNHGHTPLFKAYMSKFLGYRITKGSVIHAKTAPVPVYSPASIQTTTNPYSASVVPASVFYRTSSGKVGKFLRFTNNYGKKWVVMEINNLPYTFPASEVIPC